MNPLPFSLAPHLLDSAISTASLFVFLLLTSQPDHDFFPLQKLSFSLYNSPIDWWRIDLARFFWLAFCFNFQQGCVPGRAASFNSD
jgi:hypothetical protein